MYKSAKRYWEPIWSQRLADYNLYVGNVTQVRYNAEANFHVPYVSTLLQNVLPLLTARLPESQIIARNSDRDRNAAYLMDKLVQYTFDVNKFELTFIDFVTSGMLYGDGWIKIGWDYQNKDTDHASLQLIDSFDIYPHPNKVYLDDNWPIFVRSEMTKADMIARGWDKRTINGLGDSKLKTNRYRRDRLQALGMMDPKANTTGAPKKTDDLYEVIEVWGQMDLSFKENSDEELAMGYLVIVNDEALINTQAPKGKRMFETPYKFDKIPYVHFAYETIPNMILGQSFIRPVAPQQEELNALENMKADNYKRRNQPILLIRRGGNVDVKKLRFIAGAPWMVEEPTDVTPLEIPDLAPSIENQQEMIRTTMQARTGANDVLLVANDASLKGGDSATGAAIANENTKTRFRPHATRIDMAVERIGEMLISLYQDPRFFDRKKAIAIADDDGNYYTQSVGLKDVSGDLEFRVTSYTSIADSADVKLQRALNLKEIYAQDPTINQDEMDKQVFDNAIGYNYTKVKRPIAAMINEIQDKLEQMTMLVNSPAFQAMNPMQQQEVLMQMQSMQKMLQAVAPPPPQTQPLPGGTPQMAPASGTPNQVASEGGLQP